MLLQSEDQVTFHVNAVSTFNEVTGVSVLYRQSLDLRHLSPQNGISLKESTTREIGLIVYLLTIFKGKILPINWGKKIKNAGRLKT